MSGSIEQDLDVQIREARRSIVSDGYPMSIGELTNLYRDGELIIRPEFQRFFRWTDSQKSRLVESILLAIPLPSIFVAQTEMGKWELVDGLQRVSTILELQGELLDSKNDSPDVFVLQGTKYLPALEGKSWRNNNPLNSFTEAQRLDFKRSKVDVKIIKRESSPETKYDLFQRLNSYGSSLTSQELRSALLVSISPEFFARLEGLASYPSFMQSAYIRDRLFDERYDLELVIRFLVLHNRPSNTLTLRFLRDFTEFLNNESVSLASTYPNGFQKLEENFKTTFDIIQANGSEDVFKRWDQKRGVFKGPFLTTSFEVFALGLGYHVASGTPYKTNLIELVKSFWNRPRMQGGFATGRSTEQRLVEFIPIGREITASQ